MFGRSKSWLELSYLEHGVDPQVTWYIKLVSGAADSLLNLKGVNVLLCQFCSYFNKKKNWVPFMKFEYSIICNLYKYGLVDPVVVLFLICEAKRYCIGDIATGNISVKQGYG